MERRYIAGKTWQGQRCALKSRNFPFPAQIKTAQHLREKNRLYLQVITFRKDPSLALKNLPVTPNPTPVLSPGKVGDELQLKAAPPPLLPHPGVGPICSGKEDLLGIQALGWMGAPLGAPTRSGPSPGLKKHRALVGPATKSSRDQGLLLQWSLLDPESGGGLTWPSGPATQSLFVVVK